MKNFNFHNPTRILFGKGSIAELKDQVPADAKVLILYGGGSAERTGVLDQVREALAGRAILEFGGIEPNPRYATTLKAVEMIRENAVTFLLAVGGGSVIDATKFIAAAVKYDGDAWDILTSRGSVITQAVPFGSVLTLPATGSEMNSGGVITNPEKEAKLPFSSVHCYPVFSVLDPEVTYTLPPRQIANGVVDAFVHTTEQYLTYPVAAPVQDGFAETLLRTLIELGPKALETPEDYDIRSNLMWTATMALNGLIGAGVPQDWATHMIGHEITALNDTDHARTLAVVLPALLNDQREVKREKLLQYASNVWNIREGSNDERIDAVIEATRGFFEQMGIKTRLGDYDVDADGINHIVSALKEHGMTSLGEHKAIGPDEARRILEAAL
ncbi:iron-containing alcohol dehydrogenase [Shewanella chilikensis]|jgi:NADP-dependent alcohol dehydrogenase|uniref:Iron-containing alcohol dehydrogenase n=2 Tax=Gammaproteobacteria TaxID=1236 RepID=A0A6G7LPQ6_9GAMM|nr:iron-containing alcohol dehydrogenase [Shewanella chilikensis]MCL1164285.1 iron-containing alcohol dehydrogenase [Shewanella chilikensis]QIJ03778.1 iron-containing alcohol dehydrogenase [Shewanella chilikensis]|tara:strand:+ start:8693 stop:9850 length:1158 start_codon:yes stop_codon:yes gene_type:complete